ncbi:MAG: hypothetical protein ACYC27_16700 [Armatimonadota bacterium]
MNNINIDTNNHPTTIMLDRHTIRIPMKLKKRRGRKEIIVPDGLDQNISKPDCDMPFVIALARAHAWQELLDSGKYKSIREMARDLGICNTYMARLLRFTVLAPDIVESILDGRESDNLSQAKLIGTIPEDWRKQREWWGYEWVIIGGQR